jgi:C-methyltransferase
MKDNGKVLIVETIVPVVNEAHYSKPLNLEMLTSPGGVKRRAEEYRELLAQAEFRLTEIVPTKPPFSIIEAVKA